MHNCSQKLCIVTFDETIAEFTPSFQWGSCYSIFSFMCIFCRSLFVLLSFFFWPLCGLFFDLRILITPLVSSNSSYLPLISINILIQPHKIFPVLRS
jgi:hypothetical protein